MSERDFNKGWRDRLFGLPPKVTKGLLPTIHYERGRHAAAMWEFYLVTAEQTGTIHGPQLALLISYKRSIDEVKHVMPFELLDAIAAEERFCSLQSELLTRI